MSAVEERLDRIESVLERIESKVDATADARPALSVAAVAERLGISERVVRDMVAGRSPVIESYMIGGVRRVDQAEVDRYLAGRRAAARGESD